VRPRQRHIRDILVERLGADILDHPVFSRPEGWDDVLGTPNATGEHVFGERVFGERVFGQDAGYDLEVDSE